MNTPETSIQWKEANEKSQNWQAEQRRIQTEANQKRSEAAKGNDNAAKERAVKNSSPTRCGNTETEDKNITATAKATASRTNRGSGSSHARTGETN